MNNNCVNCKFFQKHYFVNTRMRFVEANCGRCLNDKVKNREAKKYMGENISCEFWEGDKEKNLKAEESLKTLLCRVSKQLGDIAELIDNYPHSDKPE